MTRTLILTGMMGLVMPLVASAEDAPAPVAVTPVEDPPPSKVPLAITLGNRTDSMTPDLHGAANVERAAIAVKAGAGTLSATLSGAAHAHAYIGCHATGRAPLQLMQEFDIAPLVPNQPGAALTLAAKVDGYLRSDRKGGACLRLAAVTVGPACGGPVLALSFPPACIGGCGAARYTQEAALPSQVLPAGRYLLVATFVIEATADALMHGHGEAVFTPGNPAISPGLPNNPFQDVDPKDFGFTVTLKAVSP